MNAAQGGANTIQRSAILAACADMIKACGLTLHELADELAKPALQAQPPVCAAEPVAVHVHTPVPMPELVDPEQDPEQPPEQGQKLSPQAKQVLACAARPEGITVADVVDLLGVHATTAAYHVDRLLRADMLTRRKVRGEHALRYWANAEDAQAFVSALLNEAEQQRTALRLAAEQREREAAAARQKQAAEHAEALQRRRQERAAARGAKLRPEPKPHQVLTISQPKVADTFKRPAGEPIITSQTVQTRDTTTRPTAAWQLQQLPEDPRYPSFASARPGVNPETGQAWGRTA